MNRKSFTQQTKTKSFIPPVRGILQRKCSCGNHIPAGKEYSQCSKSVGTGLLRSAVSNQQGHGLSPVSNFVPAIIQTKLTVSKPGDKYEQEADRVADAVMRIPESQVQSKGCLSCSDIENDEQIQAKPIAGRITPLAQREVEEEEMIRTKSISSYQDILQRQKVPEEETETTSFEPLLEEVISTVEVHPEGEEEDGTVLLSRMEGPRGSPESGIADRIARAHSGGRTLSNSAQSFMAPRFGYDFSKVRVHTDDRADQLSKELGAAAFTIGNNVFFRSGRFDSQGNYGRRLLAHELTHVVQQNGGHRAMTGGMYAQRFLPLSPITPFKANKIQRQIEVHVNLHGKDTVRVYRKGKKIIKYIASAGKKSTPTKQGKFTLKKRKSATKKQGRWGLQYFAIFSGGQGFHSNMSYPTCKTIKKKGCKKGKLNQRNLHLLTVDGSARSHGCVRLKHSAAQKFFEMVQDGTTVIIYNEKAWREPSWQKKKPVKKPTKPSGKSRTYTVKKDENLGMIAKKKGVTLDELKKANKDVIRKGDVIWPGDVLTIP